jgi:hypothetical protein
VVKMARLRMKCRTRLHRFEQYAAAKEKGKLRQLMGLIESQVLANARAFLFYS